MWRRYTKTTVISHIRENPISAVLISGKYIVPKSALVDFIVSDAAFEIVNKSPWHINKILMFVEKEQIKPQPHQCGGAVVFSLLIILQYFKCSQSIRNAFVFA